MDDRRFRDALAQGAELVGHLLEGKTLGPLLGHSPKEQEALYTLAFRLYGQARYADAARLFAYLLMNNHLDARYYNGFGACMQMQERPTEALRYYGMASLLDLTDPAPVMHCAECHLALGARDKALEALNYALAQARHHERHRRHVPRLEALLRFVEAPGATPSPTRNGPPAP